MNSRALLQINAFSQFNKCSLIAWSFRVILNSDEKLRSVHLPVLVLGRESKGHIPLLYNIINACMINHRQPKPTMCGSVLQRSFGRNILELLVYYLMPNKCKNLKDMKSSYLSICTSQGHPTRI